jgi:hypothetical protein
VEYHLGDARGWDQGEWGPLTLGSLALQALCCLLQGGPAGHRLAALMGRLKNVQGSFDGVVSPR